MCVFVVATLNKIFEILIEKVYYFHHDPGTYNRYVIHKSHVVMPKGQN